MVTARKAHDERKLEAARAEVPRSMLDEYHVASKTGLAVTTLRRWRWQRVGPPFMKLGGAVRYDAGALAAWLAARNVHHAEEAN
jgi:predicted DNA-binding transcriptional regulator AlpA